MKTASKVVGTVIGGTTALALAMGSAWAAGPAPAVTAVVTGGAASTAGITLQGAVAPTREISATIDLAFRNEAGAESYAIAASTPGAAGYGSYLSAAQFNSRYGPRPADVAALRSWLTRSGLSIDEFAGDQALVVHGSAAKVSAAFGGVGLRTSVAHGASGVFATSALRVPAAVAPAIDSVGGLSGPAPQVRTDSTVVNAHPEVTARSGVAAASGAPCATYFGRVGANLPKPLPFKAKAVSQQECSYLPGANTYILGVSTAKIRKLENFNAKYLGQGHTVGIVLWGNDPKAGRAASLQAGANKVSALRKGQYAAVLTRTNYRGCQPASSDAAFEQNLDIQATRTMAPAASIRYYANTRCVVPELSLASAVNANKVQVLTNSYGYPNFEYNPRDRSGGNYALGNIAHKALVKAAAEGITVLFSTGDSGDGIIAGTSRGGSPGYPATDPFAVAVGGMGFGTNSKGGVAFRSGWTSGFFSHSNGKWNRVSPVSLLGPNGVGSTGGVSAYWAAPAWQRKAGVAVRGKRVVPDISNLADGFFGGFVVFQITGGQLEMGAAEGTSVASPLTGGYVAAALNAEGRKRVGLITPALYANRKKGAVTDIFFRQDAVAATINGHPGIIGSEVPQEKLKSKPGWDNVTGLGSPGAKFYLQLH